MANKSVDEFLGPATAGAAPSGGSPSVDEFLGPATAEPPTAAPTPASSQLGHLARLTGQGLAQGAIGSIVGTAQLGNSAMALADLIWLIE